MEVGVSGSRISTGIDLDAVGKQIGNARLPHSVNRSAYGFLPMANAPAAREGTIVSPLDQGNLNRPYPGDASGSPTQMIAHFIEAELISRADLVLDLHSGGATLEYPPSTSLLSEKAEDRKQRRQLARALGAPYCTVVVPQSAGAGCDVVTRIIVHKMSEILGQPMVVANRAGAGGNIGTVHVAQVAPDGHTLLMASVGHAINPTLYRSAGFDPLKDFEPVASFTDGTLLLIAGPAFNGSTVKDVIDQSRSRPGSLLYASGGNGTINHLAGVLLVQLG